MAGDLEVRLESEHFSCDGIQVHRVSGREAISSLSSFDIEVVCLDGDAADPAAMEGAEATLVFARDGEEARRVHGMIAEIDDLLDTEVETRQLRLRLVPRAHRLTLVQTQEIFMDLAVPEIVKQKLELVELAAGHDFDLRLRHDYPKREFVVQYKESDLAFVSRLCEHLGISFVFEQHDGRDRIAFIDHAGGFNPAPGLGAVSFHGRGHQGRVHHIQARTRVIPKSYVQQDYNYRTPQVDLFETAEAPSGLGGGFVESGAHVKTPKEARHLAEVRAQEQEAAHHVFSGKSSLPELAAGARFRLEDHKHLGDIELLVVEIEHRATQATGLHGGQGERSYANTFKAIDAGLTYRPPRVTPAPRIYGLVTGIIEPTMPGDESRFAKLDEHGRYTVRFLFDNAQHGQRRASRPVRMLQAHAGPGYGTHFPLKPGVEVLLSFIDGDPDRPLIVGAVPNPTTPSPVVAKNALVHRISTETGIVLTMKDA